MARHKSGKLYPRISAKGYDYDDLTALCNLLNTNFGLSLRVNKHRHRGGWNKVVNITAASRDILFPIWKRFVSELKIPTCMHYKLGVKE